MKSWFMKGLHLLWFQILPIIYDIVVISLKEFRLEGEGKPGVFWKGASDFEVELVRILLKDLGRSFCHIGQTFETTQPLLKEGPGCWGRTMDGWKDWLRAGALPSATLYMLRNLHCLSLICR